MPKKCAFCQKSPPEVKITKEHILRSAIADIFPEMKRNGKMEWLQSVVAEDGKSHKKRYLEIPQAPFTQTINDICDRCNGGWLNKYVELASEEFLFPRLRGELLPLELDACLPISLWGAKTAAVLGLRDPPPRAVPQDDFNWIMTKLSPPPNTFVWLGRVEGAPIVWTRHYRFFAEMDGTRDVCHTTTLCIGYLVLIIIGLRHDYVVNAFEKKFAELDKLPMRRIWPQPLATDDEVLAPLSIETIFEVSSMHEYAPLPDEQADS